MGWKELIEEHLDRITSENWSPEGQTFEVFDEKSGRHFFVESFPDEWTIMKITTAPAGKRCTRCNGTGREPGHGHP